jgi:hypothetical protein
MAEGDALHVRAASHIYTPDFTAITHPYCNDASTRRRTIASFFSIVTD